MSNSFDSAILPPPRPTATASVGIASDQRTAGGPLPGNHNIAMEEAKCAAAQNNPRWFQPNFATATAPNYLLVRSSPGHIPVPTRCTRTHPLFNIINRSLWSLGVATSCTFTVEFGAMPFQCHPGRMSFLLSYLIT